MPVRGKRAERPKGHRTKASRSVSMKGQEEQVRKAGGAIKEPRKPRQPRLPTMEDAKLDELHSLAEDYVDIRDRRIALNREEKPLKTQLLQVMHGHGKSHYHHDGLIIDVVHENEKVKVKITKAAGDEGEEGEEGEAASASA